MRSSHVLPLERVALTALQAVICILPATMGRAATTPNVAEAALIEDIKAREETTTILKSRVWSEGEWNNDRHGSSAFELTFGGRKAWRISERQDWAAQVELPLKRVSATDSSHEGYADAKLTVGTAVRLGTRWRAGAGIELRAPTGKSELSANIWRLQEFVAVAWDATPWLTITPRAKYFHTLAKQRGATTQHYAELYVPTTFILPDHWSITTRYEAKIDFENDFTTHAGKLSVGKQLKRPKVGLGLALKVPFNSRTNEYSLFLDATKYF